MADIDFSAIFSNVIDGVKKLAVGSLKDFVTQAQSDAQDFIESSKNDFELWTTQLSRGEINKPQFENLVQGQADLAEMHALTQAGIAQADIQRLRDGVINLLIEAAFKAIP